MQLKVGQADRLHNYHSAPSIYIHTYVYDRGGLAHRHSLSTAQRLSCCLIRCRFIYIYIFIYTYMYIYIYIIYIYIYIGLTLQPLPYIYTHTYTAVAA